MRTAAELIEELVRLSLAGDPAQVDLWADDGRHTLMFSPGGEPVEYTKDAIRAAMAAAGPARVVDQRLVQIEVREARDTDGNDGAIAEYTTVGTIAATGAEVTLTGAMVATTRDGAIMRSRTYMNPDVLRSIGTPAS